MGIKVATGDLITTIRMNPLIASSEVLNNPSDFEKWELNRIIRLIAINRKVEYNLKRRL